MCVAKLYKKYLEKLFGVDGGEPGSKTIVSHILKYVWLNCTINILRNYLKPKRLSFFKKKVLQKHKNMKKICHIHVNVLLHMQNMKIAIYHEKMQS